MPASDERLSAVQWRDGRLQVIDQTLLPERLEIRTLRSAAEVVDAMRRLVVRGAPALGVCGAFGVVVGLDERGASGADAAREELERLAAEIGSARPTAANLSWAVRRVADAAARGASTSEVRDLALREAIRIRDEDVEACRRIGEYGRVELAGARRILTHCNAGRLAAAGIGTALGVVYAKADAGEPVEVVATETRPLGQGARLTAWELAAAGIPVTLVADAAGAAAIATGRIDAVIVGCDRVARNGDVANKIGTYGLAAAASASGVAFYVAGPMSSFDPAVSDGTAIEIEERSAAELATGPPGVEVWNPAFDVTPAASVTAFITETGVLRPPYEASIRRALGEVAGADASRARP